MMPNALQLTAAGRRSCNPSVRWPPSLSSGVFATLRFHGTSLNAKAQRPKGAERMYLLSVLADPHGEFRESRPEIFEME